MAVISSSSNIVADAAPNKIPHKADSSHPNGSSPWPKYGERPDTNTPEVKAWVKLVDWSKVPKLPVRKVESPGDAPTCPGHDVPKSDCWWTCTGCFVPDDIVDCPQKNQWGLTFDDGPQPGTTEDLLDLLKEKNVTATFFVTGMKSMMAPWLLQDTIDQGHHLASHTWSHSGMTTLTNEEVVAELKWTEKYIYDHTGYKVKYYRPPYGDVDNRVRAIARELGFRTVIWSNEWDTQDWQLEEDTITSKQIVGIFKKDLKSLPKRDRGVITLEHDSDPKMIAMARTLLDMGLMKGMKPMDIAQCLGDKVGYNAVPVPDNKPSAMNVTKPVGNVEKLPMPNNTNGNTATTQPQKKPAPKDAPKKGSKDETTSEDQNVPGSVTQEAINSKKKSSGSDRSSHLAGLSVACWTLAAVAASFVF
ncbi:hypothetical protein EDD21DRAFT_309259 [Dissophora ornata]|nr:hypothetical protein EDD21DRAFT_309259 [Dissophora ornata]